MNLYRAGTLSRIVLQLIAQYHVLLMTKAPILQWWNFVHTMSSSVGYVPLAGAMLADVHFAEVLPPEGSRLPVVHNIKSPIITREEAKNLASVAGGSLLPARKLFFALDLEHTLVHATDDPCTESMIQYSPINVGTNCIRKLTMGSKRDESALVQTKRICGSTTWPLVEAWRRVIAS